MSFSIGGASLAPQQLAAPQDGRRPRVVVDVAKDAAAAKRHPPGIGKVVDKTA